MWWSKHNVKLPDNPHLHQAVIAYMSDDRLAMVAWQPYQEHTEISMSVSLDHSLHFHRNARADEWLLFHVETTVSSQALGLVSGNVFRADGVMCASIRQEALVRVQPAKL